MKFDKYSLTGRIAPAFFSIIIPIIVFNSFYVSEEFAAFVGEILAIKVATNITVPIICLFFLSQFGRIIGKNIFEKAFFKDERLMPTTSFLLFSDDNYSEQHKQKIRNKMETDFNSKLPSKEEEAADIENSKTTIVELMALVRKKLKNNQDLLQHNIEYGAMRNLIGGSVLGAIISIFNIVFFSSFVTNELATNISVFTLFIYVSILLFSKVLISAYGKSYAKILFREYLSEN